MGFLIYLAYGMVETLDSLEQTFQTVLGGIMKNLQGSDELRATWNKQ